MIAGDVVTIVRTGERAIVERVMHRGPITLVAVRPTGSERTVCLQAESVRDEGMGGLFMDTEEH